jgi:hypothetical protein
MGFLVHKESHFCLLQPLLKLCPKARFAVINTSVCDLTQVIGWLASDQHAFVSDDTGSGEQGPDVGSGAENLEVTEGIVHPSDCCGFLGQYGCAICGERDVGCVEEDRRSAGELEVSADEGTVCGFYTADFRSDDLDFGTALGRCRLEGIDELGIGAVGDENADLLRLYARDHLLDDAERRGGLKVGACGGVGGRGRDGVSDADTIGNALRNVCTDVGELPSMVMRTCSVCTLLSSNIRPRQYGFAPALFAS